MLMRTVGGLRGLGPWQRIIGAFVALAVLLTGDWWWRMDHRPQPPDLNETLFRGIVYHRFSLKGPRPMVVHVVEVDLRNPGISFLSTPGDSESPFPYRAQTTSQFADEYGTQIAVNGDFFEPWHDAAPWDYYPHIGDGCRPLGPATSRGVPIYRGPLHVPTIYITLDRKVSFGPPADSIYDAVSGDCFILRDGQPTGAANDIAYHGTPQPRTAVGVDRDRTKLILLVVDGRQPGYSEGAMIGDLGRIGMRFGLYDMINLDGGGSSTLAIKRRGRPAEVLNVPISSHIPGNERPVANHLGVYAKSLDGR